MSCNDYPKPSTSRAEDHLRQIEKELLSLSTSEVDVRRKHQLLQRKASIEEHFREVKSLERMRDKLGLFQENPDDVFKNPPIHLPAEDEPAATEDGEPAGAVENAPAAVLLPADLPDDCKPPPGHVLPPNMLVSQEALEREKNAGVEGEQENTEAYNSDSAHMPFGRLMESVRRLDSHIVRIQYRIESYPSHNQNSFLRGMDRDFKILLFLQRARAVTIRHAVEVLEVGCRNLALDFICWSRFRADDVNLSYLRSDLRDYQFSSVRCAQLVSSASSAFEQLQKELNYNLAPFSSADGQTQDQFDRNVVFHRVIYRAVCNRDFMVQKQIKTFQEELEAATKLELSKTRDSLVAAYRMESAINEHGDALFAAEASAVAFHAVRGYKYDPKPALLAASRAALTWACDSVCENAVNIEFAAVSLLDQKAKFSSARLLAALSRLTLLKKAKAEILRESFGTGVSALDPILETLASVIIPCCSGNPKPSDILVLDGKPSDLRARETDGEEPAHLHGFKYLSKTSESTSWSVGLHVSEVPSLETVGDVAIRDVMDGLHLLFNDESMALDKLRMEKRRTEHDLSAELAQIRFHRDRLAQFSDIANQACSFCIRSRVPPDKLGAATELMPCCKEFLCSSCGSKGAQLTNVCVSCRRPVSSNEILKIGIRVNTAGNPQPGQGWRVY